MKNTDLHTHSYYSDGRKSPKEVVRLAKKRGVRIMALTDHNTTKGIKEAIEEGKKLGVRIIPGIEVVAKEDEVLGYFIDVKNRKFQNEIAKIRKNIENKIRKRCRNIQKKGFPVSFSEIQKRFPKAKGNINDFYPYYLLILKEYGKNFSEVGRLLKKSGVKKVKGKYISITNAIKLIRCARGVAVLAHPWADEKSERLLEEKNFIRLVKSGLQGIEIDNGDRDGRRNTKIIKRIKFLSKKYGLVVTSGSDFHGEDLQNARTHLLGRRNCDEEVVNKLKSLSGKI